MSWKRAQKNKKPDYENEKEDPSISQKAWTLDKGTMIRGYDLWWINTVAVCCVSVLCQKGPQEEILWKMYPANLRFIGCERITHGGTTI